MSVAKFDLLYRQLIADDETKSPSASYQTTAPTRTTSEPGPGDYCCMCSQLRGTLSITISNSNTVWHLSSRSGIGEHHHFSPEARIRDIPRADRITTRSQAVEGLLSLIDRELFRSSLCSPAISTLLHIIISLAQCIRFHRPLCRQYT